MVFAWLEVSVQKDGSVRASDIYKIGTDLTRLDQIGPTGPTGAGLIVAWPLSS